MKSYCVKFSQTLTTALIKRGGSLAALAPSFVDLGLCPSKKFSPMGARACGLFPHLGFR